MKKRKLKTMKIFAGISLLLSVSFGVSLFGNVAANADGQTTVSTTAIVGKTDGEVTLSEMKSSTASRTEKDAGGNTVVLYQETVTGLSIAPNVASDAWEADLNIAFSDNATITYFLPNQYGSNSDIVANAFHVNNAAGERVASFVNVGSHWASLAAGKAYLHNAVTDTYTTARTYWNATKQVNEYDETKAPIELTPTEENVYYLSTFGDDMYVSPKVGTQIGAYTLDTQEVSGTVFFEYANGVLTVKTTTYDVQGRDDASLKASGNGQTITLGTVETDLSKGYTISVGSAPSIDTGNGEKSYQYSSSVIITKINDVLFSDGTVSSENGAVTDIRYGTETVVRGDAAISIREGDELKTFDVYAKFKVGGALSSVTSSKVYEISATETFAGKQAGKYPLTVSAGDFDKTYTVFVEKTYEVSSGEILSSEENAKLTLNSKLGDYKGVLLDRVTDGNPARTANVNGVFSNSASVSFLFEKGIASGTEGHEFVVFDRDGNEVASAVHYYVQAWQGGGARAYVCDRLTDTYMKPKSDGSYETMTALETSMYGGVNVAPIPYATNSAINYDGTYYDVETAAGTIYFEYDKAERTLTVKISTPQKTRLTPDHEKNVGKTENLASPARIVTVGVVKDVDLSDGYTLGIREAKDFKDGDGQFSTPSAKMLILDVNGVSLADNSVKVTSGGIVQADFLGEAYSFDPASEEATKFYLAKNGSLDGLTVTALKKFADGWVERVTAQNATIVSENGYGEIGEYAVNLVAELDGISYATPINLVVENSAKVAFDSKGGTAFAPVYVSAHNWNHALPTPERFGWIFTGWYNGDELVKTLSGDFEETTLVAKWLDETPPVVNLNGLQSVTVVDNAAKFKIEKSDVLAEDMAWGLLGDEYITVRVKAPFASEFVSLENFTFNSEFGEYEIVYSVKDCSGNSAEISRILKYMPTRPVLTVEGSFPEKGYVNEKILLPAANAKSGENTIAYSVSVVCDGVEIAVENGAFVPVTTGTYSVVYAAVDDNGLTAVETFEILIVEDVTAPVLSVDFTVTELKIGETLSLPIATVTDDADDNATVTVEIRKGLTVISDKSVVIPEAGIYTVVYTATDFSGNQSSLTFEVFVSSGASGATSGGEKDGGCGASVGAGNALVWLTACAAVFVFKKKKIN